MTSFNEYNKKIITIMENNIICVYYLFDKYAFKYYNHFNIFSIQGHEVAVTRHITEVYNEINHKRVIYRNTEDWYKNDFLVFLRKCYLEHIIELLITKEDMNLYFEELTALLSLGIMDVNNKQLHKVISVYYATYYVNNLTFEDFKTLLYENEIYNDAFMDHADLK